ncbi:MAG: sulfite exporter TauE/SafE family protein [Acidobacteriota bacterium]|nr:MAG: sulfite exporter TauE/SafE family protein [Acidobacteriota bacterium]
MDAFGLPASLSSLGWSGVVAALATGVVAGFFNVTAGGGSLLTVPLLILYGLPGPLANGTNRVALVAQNLVAVPTFRLGGVRGLRHSGVLMLAALPGAIAGAWTGAVIDDALFRRLLGGLMIAMTAVVLIRPRGEADTSIVRTRFRLLTLLAFVMLGFYAGFIQAGIGFLIVFALVGLERFPLVRAHAFKVALVLVLQLAALPVFAAHGKVNWPIGILLAVGLAIGGFAGARVALKSSERVLRWLLAAAALGLALRLLLFP